jgi:hypothetical protein
MISSEITKVEVARAARRLRPDVAPAARALVRQLDLLRLTGALIDEAADFDGPLPRTLDAVHLASALSVGADLTAFVAYDDRLAEAAESVGTDTVQPSFPAPGSPRHGSLRRGPWCLIGRHDEWRRAGRPSAPVQDLEAENFARFGPVQSCAVP